MNATELAKIFHNTYERLAPQYGYNTREDTKDFKANSPNGRLMIATCYEILNIPDIKKPLVGIIKNDTKSINKKWFECPKCKNVYELDI